MSTLQTSSLNVTAESFSYHRLPLTKKKTKTQQTTTTNHKPTISQIMPPVQRHVLWRGKFYLRNLCHIAMSENSRTKSSLSQKETLTFVKHSKPGSESAVPALV